VIFRPKQMMAKAQVTKLVSLLGLIAVGICSGASAAKPAAKVRAGFAIAINPNYVGYWVAAGRKDGASAAKAALAMCRKATGHGCDLAASSKAGHLAIGYGIDGSLNFATQDDKDATIRTFEVRCLQTYRRPCLLEQSINLANRADYGELNGERKFAALAGEFEAPDPVKRDPRIWIATGQPNAQAAIEKAMSGCVAALGRNACKYFTTNGQTHIALHREVAGISGGFLINLSREEVAKDVHADCEAAKITCEIVAFHATSVGGIQEYNLRTAQRAALD
jgi:hypothetical protein